MRVMTGLAVGVAAICGAACGSGDKQAKPGEPPKVVAEAGVSEAVTPPAAAMIVGLESPAALGFRYRKGKKAFEAASVAVKSGDWATARDASAQAVADDPGHLDAQLMLARANAELGARDAVRKPLMAALAGDYLAYAGELEGDGALATLVRGDSELAAAVAALRQTYLDRAKGGLFVVARRTGFRHPKPSTKVKWAATRAELFAYDRETERYLRLTHTKESVAGWLLSPSGDELAVVSYSGAVRPASDAQPTLLGWAKISLLDLDSLTVRGKPASVPGTPRSIRLGYRTGDELVVELAPPAGRWQLGSPTTYVFDRGKSRLKKAKSVTLDAAEVLAVDYDRVVVERGQVAQIQADPEATSFRLLPTNTTVTMPAGDVVASGGYLWSPDRVHLVVRTMPRPCEGQRESSLYLVDAATGNLKNILRGVASFQARWIDNDHFVYEDDEGALRLYDVEVRTQVGRLENKGGVGLIGVAATRGPICTVSDDADPAATPDAEPAGDEPAADQPVDDDADG